jgi:hypothetical protein
MEKKPISLEDLLSQINETMQIIQNHKGPINITPELLADIDKLEAATGDFKETSQALFNLLDINSESYKKEVLESSATRSSDKQLIKRAEDIAREARVMKLALSKSIERGKGRKRERLLSKNGDKQQQMKERRKLFKPLGGDQKWLPL